MFCDPMVRRVHLQIRQSPVFIQEHLSLTPLGLLPDPQLSSFNRGGSASTYQSHFCRGFPQCHYRPRFCFCRRRRPWGLEMQGTVPVRLREKGTAGGVGNPSGHAAFPSFDGRTRPAPSPSPPEPFEAPYLAADPLAGGHGVLLRSHLNQKLFGLFFFFLREKE